MIWEPGATRPLSEADKKAWDARLDRARQRRKQYEPAWNDALKRYRDSKANKYDVNALKDFTHVESKKAALNFETPEIQLHPKDPTDEMVPLELLPLRQKVLNHVLGEDGADAKAALDQALFDCLAPSGFLSVEVGFDVRLAPDPVTQQQIPVWGKPFVSRVSPMKLVVPDEFRSTQFDTAPWLAIDGTMPLARAKREFTLPEGFSATATRDETVFTYDEARQGHEPLVEFTKIWYVAEQFDESVINPELYRLLILVKGLDAPAKHIDSPFQAVDELGQLTPMSMRGNPIHVGTLRDLSDSAYVASDLEVGEQLSHEINSFRTDNIRNKRARVPLTFIDPDGLPTGEIKKIKNGEKVLFTKPGQLASGNANTVVAVANMGSTPRDDYTAQDYAERDREMALGSGSPLSGVPDKKKATATETRVVATGAGARSESERGRFRRYLVKLVRKLDAVLNWTMTAQDVTQILGQQGGVLWEQWRSLPGCYTYRILPDSGVHVDAQSFRAQKIDEYNMLRKDPQVNATELLKTVARALGYDPAKMILEQAPEQGPEPIKSSVAFKGEDFIGPQSQAVVEILAQMGITISPQAIATLQQAQMIQMAGMASGELGPDGKPVAQGPGSAAPHAPAQHGGSAPKTEPINQHQRERTGGVNGVAA